VSELVAFVRARLNELAEAARAEVDWRRSLPDVLGATVVISPLLWAGWDDPEFVLAEVKAKRAIVDRYERTVQRADAALHDGVFSEPDDEVDVRLALEWVVRQFAAVYDQHQDYRREWRPGA
jgi:Family of unknown function (DUF6221)